MATMLIKNQFRNVIAEGIYNEILSKTGRYYYFLGKALDWNVDDTPPDVVDDYATELEARNNIIFTKQVTSSDVSFVIPRYDWESGVIFDMYDDSINVDNPAYSGASKLENAKYYALTTQYNVYKCIDNNLNAPSTTMPTDTSDSVITYADGYKWKYMYTIPASLRNKFLTATDMPVMTALTTQFYSSGEITTLTIDAAGSAYVDATTAIVVDGDGVGTGATPIATTSGSWSGGNATINTASAHGLTTGGTVVVAGVTPAGYNGTYTVTVTDADTFTYAVANPGGVITVQGTITRGAYIDPIVSGGQVTGYTIHDGGEGFTYANLTVTGVGTGALISANFTIGDITSPQSNVELFAVQGTIDACVVTDGGQNYNTVAVSIDGDGTGAEATATISAGVVTKITITTPGQDYTWATVSITGDGTGATARAIMSPIGGHGKNAIDEFSAKTLTLYSTISAEKNQGMTTNNDYRQTGIIKQIEEFGTGLRYTGLTGSTCFKVDATYTQAQFPDDTIVYNNDTNRQFIVVETTATSLLLLPIDGQDPEVGVTYRNDAMNTFVISSITEPQVEAFSGDLLFIDNREGFIPSSSQSVVIRSVLRF